MIGILMGSVMLMVIGTLWLGQEHGPGRLAGWALALSALFAGVVGLGLIVAVRLS